MNNNVVYLVCGVPGSGKSWVCNQLTDKFHYVRHDDYIIRANGSIVSSILFATSPKPILADCPFGERALRERLESVGHIVKPFFIVEPLAVVQKRYLKRTGYPLPKAAVTRCASIINRADEWGAPRGTSEQVLQMLRIEGAK